MISLFTVGVTFCSFGWGVLYFAAKFERERQERHAKRFDFRR